MGKVALQSAESLLLEALGHLRDVINTSGARDRAMISRDPARITLAVEAHAAAVNAAVDWAGCTEDQPDETAEDPADDTTEES